MQARGKLAVLYESDTPESEMDVVKQSVFRGLRSAYAQLREGWFEGEEFYHWMQEPLTNAKLETVADYNEWVPVLTNRLARMGFEQFKNELSRLAGLPREEREADLGAD